MNKNDIEYICKILYILIILTFLMWYIVFPLKEAFADYTFITKWPDQPYDISHLKGIAVDNSGYVYVADTHRHRIQKFTSDGIFIDKWGSFGMFEGMFYWPESLAIDSSDNVYVTDTDNNRIQKFKSDGSYICQWGKQGNKEGQFKSPRGIAVDSNNYVYVSDTENHRIQKFTSKGKFITSWGNNGIDYGQFREPRGIAVDQNGYVYVCDTRNRRIQKFTSKGEFVKTWGDHGIENGEFSYPEGLVVDQYGNVYVSDRGNNRVQKFDSNGKFVTKWGGNGSGEKGEGTGDGEFNEPTGIAIDCFGNIYVSEYINMRIQKFSEGINAKPPKAEAGPNMVTPKNTKVLMVGENTNSKDSSTSLYKWDFDWNGKIEDFNIEATGKKVVHSFPNIGVYKIGLKVENVNGASDYDDVIIEVLNNLSTRAYLPNITKNYCNWTTDLAIQNIGQKEAIIQVHFLDKKGQPVLVKTYDDLKPNASIRLEPENEDSLSEGFQGSAVIYSNQAIASAVFENSPQTAMAYEGINPKKANRVAFLPYITRNHNGWTSPFVIQNLGQAEANIDVCFFKEGATSLTYKKRIEKLPVGSSTSLNPSNIPELEEFEGSVVLRSNQEISAVVNNHLGLNKSMSYSSLSSGKTNIFLPDISYSETDCIDPLIIQNTGKDSSYIDIQFYQSVNGTPFWSNLVPSLFPGACLINNPVDLSTGIFHGSVAVNSTREEIIAVHNSLIKDDAVSNSINCESKNINYLPDIKLNYQDWSSKIKVNNSNKVSAAISVRFFDQNGKELEKVSGLVISPMGFVIINPVFYTSLGESFRGSAVIESLNDKKIKSTVINENSKGQATSYNGF